MNSIFLVLGYGIPKNILQDENYNLYLKIVFNKIYDICVKNKSEKSLIILSGGETDIFKPYKRNEADEINKIFTVLIKQRKFINSITKNWSFAAEKKSLSTLENLIYSKKIIQKLKTNKTNFFIFCEQTREKRVKILTKKVFEKNFNFQVLPIDFDMSANRYLSPDFLAKKEKAVLEHDLWALQNPKNLKKYHKVFEEKLKFLRNVGPEMQVEALRKWWEYRLKEIKK